MAWQRARNYRKHRPVNKVNSWYYSIKKKIVPRDIESSKQEIY